MNVEDIPVPAMAAIRVSKEGKSALFETTISGYLVDSYNFGCSF